LAKEERNDSGSSIASQDIATIHREVAGTLPHSSGGNIHAFPEHLGHEKQGQFLQSAMARNRMPHAYLFCGMKGVGKKTTALVVARR